MNILGHVVEFDELTHTYTVDGVIVPSVSTILGATLFKGKYDGVDLSVLRAKAEWGKQVHHAIETDDVSNLDELQFQKYDEYLGITLKNDLQPLLHEQVVFYKVDDKVVYIGTFDLLAQQLGSLLLCDIKTTYTLDLNYLIWQLSMYKLAYEQMYQKEIDGLFAIWLPKRESGKFVRVDNHDINKGKSVGEHRVKTVDEIKEVLISYEQTII